MALTQYQYILGQSASETITQPGEEGDINLSLQPNANNETGGNISGTVTNASGDPVDNAYIKLMSTNYKPVMHTMSNSKGMYSFNNVPAGSYTIFCIAPGMSLDEGQPITVDNYGNYIRDFTLNQDPNALESIIVGDLTNAENNQPINGASVFLYSISGIGTQSLLASTYSNQYGQYAFCEVPNGNYNIVITAENYETLTVPIAVTKGGSINELNEALKPSSSSGQPEGTPGTLLGTISGIIKDINNNNTGISGANVVLYSVSSDGTQTPIASTTTNTNGLYLFTGIKPGTYFIEATALKTL